MILVLAALSKADTNVVAADFASSASPDSAAALNFLFKVFKRVLIPWLRSVCPAVLRIFFIADFVFAIVENCGTPDLESASLHVKRLIELALDFVSRILSSLSDGYSFI